MTELRRKPRSLVSVTVTKPCSPAYSRCTSGKECLKAQARAKSAEEMDRRHINTRNGLSSNLLLSTPTGDFRSRSSERPERARRMHQKSVLLSIPSITVHDVSTDGTPIEMLEDNSDRIMRASRSRSSSPFDWITRERLPCGSPTFEKVLCDMLSDTEISPKNSDTENNEDANASIKKKTSKRITKNPQKSSYRNKSRKIYICPGTKSSENSFGLYTDPGRLSSPGGNVFKDPLGLPIGGVKLYCLFRLGLRFLNKFREMRSEAKTEKDKPKSAKIYRDYSSTEKDGFLEPLNIEEDLVPNERITMKSPDMFLSCNRYPLICMTTRCVRQTWKTSGMRWNSIKAVAIATGNP